MLDLDEEGLLVGGGFEGEVSCGIGLRAAYFIHCAGEAEQGDTVARGGLAGGFVGDGAVDCAGKGIGTEGQQSQRCGAHHRGGLDQFQEISLRAEGP